MLRTEPRPTARAELPPLTPREKEIVELIGQELSNKQIATLLHLELTTVKNHIHNILTKLNVRRRTDAVALLRSARR